MAPNSVILLEARDEFLFEMAKRLPEKEVVGTHFNERDMKRRLKVFRALVDNSNGAPIVTDFFQENSIDILTIQLEKQ